jgi:hypothetical protein
LPVSYRQNCIGDRFLLCLQGLTSVLAAVRVRLPGVSSGFAAFWRLLGVAAAGLVVMVAVVGAAGCQPSGR